MAAKRNKAKNEEVKAQVPAPEAEPQTEAPVVEEQVSKPAPINADEMAASIKVSGNSYQQYARQMFKDRLEEGR